MITETGRVVAVEQDGLWVATVNRTICHACRAKNGCGQHLLGELQRNESCVKAVLTSASNEIWRVGDRVQIGVDEVDFVLATLKVYLVPLFVMLAALAAGWRSGLSEPMLALGSLIALSLAAIVIRYFPERNKFSKRNGKPEVVVLGREIVGK